MKALVFKRYGGPDQAMLAEIPRPVLKPDKILVDVHAGGLNPVDNMTRAGKMKAILRFQLPATLGSDVAGVVLEVGNRVTRFKPGAGVLASVFGMGTGSLAEFAVVPENSLACGSTPPSPPTWSPTWRKSRRAPSKAFLDSHQGENW